MHAGDQLFFRRHDLPQIPEQLGQLIDILDALGFVLIENALPELGHLLLDLRR